MTSRTDKILIVIAKILLFFAFRSLTEDDHYTSGETTLRALSEELSKLE